MTARRVAHIYELMDRATVKVLVQEHLSGIQNRGFLIWSLLNFNEWLEAIECYL